MLGPRALSVDCCLPGMGATAVGAPPLRSWGGICGHRPSTLEDIDLLVLIHYTTRPRGVLSHRPSPWQHDWQRQASLVFLEHSMRPTRAGAVDTR